MRPLITAGVFLAFWWAITTFLPIPSYMLPTPQAVAAALVTQSPYLLQNTLVTLTEILAGLILGTFLGAGAALAMAAIPPAARL
jgi:putative hydroxymethylpyrimidine transport system permease protein